MNEQPATAAETPTAFFSYARIDAPIVQAFAQELRSAGVQVFLDVEFLKPGDRFEKAILDKVRSADALVAFVSPASLHSKWVETELIAFSAASNKSICPVLINGADYHDLPASLAEYQALKVENSSAIPAVAHKLAETLSARLSGSRKLSPEADRELSPEAERRATVLAAGIADGIRARVFDPAKAANSVFLVHGHDHGFRDEVEQHLQALGIQPVILSKVGAGSQSLLYKFQTQASQARFAVILMSADDLGASRLQYENSERGGEQTLKYRARENVILELGFFYGRLGWENVFVVQKPAKYTWPDFERPSDLAGAEFLDTSGELDWRQILREKLVEAKLLISPSD
jgi:predicted nucleotide-binding protein